ncbi:MAG TPA: orotate phosphoribosyltransferase [Methanomicrobiales archaeon]|jgi:orotate phosphoribosyltransferase|nr:orotate phosphoribosyltransferase [Methanomicrobiales archaeon]
MVNPLARLLASHGAIRHGDFVLASGARSKLYVDIKSALTDPVVLSAIAQEIAGRCRFDAVAGVAVGGVPLAVSVSLAAGKPYVIVRAGEKGYGTGGRIIGEVKGRSLLLVEDVTTTGGSVLGAIRLLREAGAVVDRVVAVVDRGEGAAKALGAEGVELTALVTLAELGAEGEPFKKRG